MNEGDITPKQVESYFKVCGASMRQVSGRLKPSFLIITMFFFMLRLSTLINEKPAILVISNTSENTTIMYLPLVVLNEMLYLIN